MKTPEAPLIELLARVGARNGTAVLITDDELSRWPHLAVAAMKSQQLLTKARPASSAICPGCEQACAMPVYTQPAASGNSASFIVCDKRSDINRVPVATDRLTQWQCDADAVSGFIARSLGLLRSDQRLDDAHLRNIGIASGDQRTQMLCLRVDGVLTLVAGNLPIPLAELIGFEDCEYSVDGARIRRLVDTATTADPRYTPSIAKREARKLDTHAKYRRWQKEYRSLKKLHRNMSDVWYSQKIAKLEIGAGQNAETIRKHMKK